MPKIKLKPCPKCLSNDVRITGEKRHPHSLLDDEICYFVICDGCWLQTSQYIYLKRNSIFSAIPLKAVHTPSKAATIWNTRA